MHYSSKAALAAAILLLTTASARAQVSGTVSVPSATYPTLASVVTALNTQGVGAGGAIINIAAGNPQTAPSGGYLLGSATLNASTSATNTIVINGNANIATASVGTSIATDGIFVIQGVDYLTINGLNLSESAGNTTALTQMEWGYALVKRNASAPFDGCQHVRIQNCTVVLDKTNAASVGIYGGNHTAASTTPIVPTAAADANSDLLLYGNTIQNSYTGISLTGASGTAFFDTGNDIGNTAAGNGNTIQNFGGGSTTQIGIIAVNQNNVIIAANTINNAAGGGPGGNAALTGISLTNSGSASIDSNIITLQQGTTGNTGIVTAISNNTTGTAGNTTISDNIISGSGGGTGAWNGIDLAGMNPGLTINNNTFKDIALSTTAAAHLIHQTATAATGMITIANNTLSGTSTPYFTKSAGGNFAFYFNTIASTSVNTNISGNSITQVALTGGTTFYGIYSFDVTPSGTKVVSGNTVNNITGGTSAMYGIAAGNAATSDIYGNTVSGLSGGGIIYALHIMGNTAANVYKNKVTSINGVSTNATVYGAYCNTTTGYVRLYNNFFTDLTAPATSSNTGVNGIYGAAGNVNATNNTIVIGKLAPVTGGANFSCAGIYSSSPLTLRNNIIYVNANATGTGVAACIKRNSVTNPVGTPPTSSAFNAGNNVYYINPAAQNYMYVEGITTATVKNGYAISGLTASTTNNIVNDPQINKNCGAYKGFMFYNQETESYYENNITALTAGTYAPTGISYAESGATPTFLFTDDFAGITRSNPSDIGALEFAGTAIISTMPSIGHTAIGNLSICAAAPMLDAMIDAVSPATINVTNAPPRVYYKKTTEANVFGTYPADNIASFNGWKYVTGTAGTAPNFSFQIDYTKLFTPIAVNDTIQYFIVAEDNATVPNVAMWVGGFTGGYCLSGVNIPPAAGSIANTPRTSRFTILPPASIDTALSGRVVLCAGDSTTLVAANGYAAYQWLFNNTVIPGATDSFYTAYNAGTYKVAIATAGGCRDTSAVRTIIVHPLPTPVITQSGLSLSTSTYIAYEWLLNGVVIPGETGPSYTATQTGNYSVTVTDVNGCKGTSLVIAVNVENSVNTIDRKYGIKIYPNPARNTLQVTAAIPVLVSICSLDGKLLLQTEHTDKIDITSLSNGLYMLKITDKNSNLIGVEKFLKKD